MPSNPQQQLKDLLDAYTQLFATDNGKMVLKDLEKTCGLYISAFDVNPYTTAFNEGQRNVILHIRRMLTMKPEQLPEGGI